MTKITNEVTNAAVSWLAKDFSTMVVTELTARSYWGGRFDVVAITPNTELVQIIEVKTTRSDFLQGRNKLGRDGRTQFERYITYCNQFFIAVPAGLVKKSEIPGEAGLIEVWESGLKRCTKYVAQRDLKPITYQLILSRVLQKLIVEGHRWSQETHWKQQQEVYDRRWKFRDWLDAWEGRRRHEKPRSQREVGGWT